MTMTTVGCASADIALPAPDMKGGSTFGKTLDDRRSCREFDPTRSLDEQQLSNLLWAACGINRPEEGKRTNPTALNKQEISVYVFTKDGVSLYDAQTNTLKSVAEGDHRNLIAGQQEFVMDAPVSLLIVADIDKFEMPGNDRATLMGAIDAGIVCENINLYCAANGLATVPRASMDTEAIVRLLKLSKNQLPLMNNPVGYAR